MGDTLRCSCRACSDCCGAKRGDGSSTGSSVAMRSLAFGSAGGGAGGALLLLVTPPASPLSAWAACSLAMVASASRNLATIVAWRNATRLNCATPPQPRSSHHTSCQARARGERSKRCTTRHVQWASCRFWQPGGQHTAGGRSAQLYRWPRTRPMCSTQNKYAQCTRSLVPRQPIQHVHKPQAHPHKGVPGSPPEDRLPCPAARAQSRRRPWWQPCATACHQSVSPTRRQTIVMPTKPLHSSRVQANRTHTKCGGVNLGSVCHQSSQGFLVSTARCIVQRGVAGLDASVKTSN